MNGMEVTSCCVHVILEVFLLVYDMFLIFHVKIRTMKPALKKVLQLTNVVTLSTNVHLKLNDRLCSDAVDDVTANICEI